MTTATTLEVVHGSSEPRTEHMLFGVSDADRLLIVAPYTALAGITLGGLYGYDFVAAERTLGIIASQIPPSDGYPARLEDTIQQYWRQTYGEVELPVYAGNITAAQTQHMMLESVANAVSLLRSAAS